MDKNSIKKFAVWARTELITRVSQRAIKYEIDENGFGEYDADAVNGRVMSAEEKTQRKALIDRIRTKGYHQVMEEVAYTWFNRFSALRFMEVNGYLPSRTRVFTDDNNNFKPQIITDAIDLNIDGLDMDKVYALKDDAKKEEELYKYLLITQCNALNPILPGTFQKISDYTELLFPDNLLRENSVIQKMIELIPQQDWEEQVEILGWLYQYYINEPKDKLINAKKQYKLDDVPFVTQIFTSDWIVKYMVQNSLGRMWINAGDKDLKDYDWDYYLQERDGAKKDTPIDPGTIKVVDPCMGSGHILVYVFDVLIQMYDNYGYNQSDAVESILQNNIYGMDISERAYQLAYFSLMMRARKYSRTVLNKGIKPHLYCLENIPKIREELIDFIADGDSQIKEDITLLQHEIEFLGEYGSLIETSAVDYLRIEQRLNEIENIEYDNLIEQGYRLECIYEIKSIIDVGKSLNMQYDSVITNPPYIGNKFLPARLKEYIEKNYRAYKSDIFAAFMVRVIHMTKDDGHIGMLTPYVWMFISAYGELRKKVLSKTRISTLVQLEYNAFESACVPVCSFTLKKSSKKILGEYVRLSEFKGATIQGMKVMESIENRNCGFRYTSDQENYNTIPGFPIAYWVTNNLINAFKNTSLYEYSISPSQNITGNNDKWIRKHWELDSNVVNKPDKWIFYAKGGGYRKWWGNLNEVVNWTPEARKIYQFGDGKHASQIINKQYWYKKGITWGLISSVLPSFRVMPEGATYDKGGSTIIVNEEVYNFSLALLNSKVYLTIATMLNPTLNFQVKDVRSVPLILKVQDVINSLADNCINLSKDDWNSFETSWNFERHPMLPVHNDLSGFAYKMEDYYHLWKEECEKRFNQLKENEEELNRIFIDIYGLQGELAPEVEDKDVTVSRADLERDVRSFISYAVGCMFGRYSLDADGLVYAGGEWDETKYSSFAADSDNIIPICDDEYFEDDIVGRFVKFVEVVYGAKTLQDNLKFIADALGGKGQPKEVIRNYFLNGFYADHCKMYQKRPIYWLFDSGKKNGFKCLIYMHRYQPDTIARIRTDYVHEQQSRYRTAAADIEQRLLGASGSEKVKLDKQKATLQAQIIEIGEYEEKIHHLADQMIRIDLDDGVKHNYEIFKDVLAKIK